MALPDREASLLRRVTETSSGTLWMVRMMAVSPLAGLKQSMPTHAKQKSSIEIIKTHGIESHKCIFNMFISNEMYIYIETN